VHPARHLNLTVAQQNQLGMLHRWRERLKALRNVPQVLRMATESARSVVISSLAIRLVVALLPLSILAITRFVIDSISRLKSGHQPLPPEFWWMVLLEFSLACLGMILNRLIDFCDAVFADRYARYIDTRIIDHAGRLDLESFEDPGFHDKLERARMQGTERIGMIQAVGKMIQQLITACSLIVSIWFFSPLIVLVLAVCLIPGFIGETHFAFLSYSLNYNQTAARREMDYLRLVGASRESIKELKLFHLSPFLIGRYFALADETHSQTVRLARRRLWMGSLLTLLGAAGYYATYGLAIFRTVKGESSLGTLTFLSGAIAGTSSGIQTLLQTFSAIAEQALFLSDLLEFLAVKPKVVSKPGALAIPRPIRLGFEFRDVSFTYPGNERRVLSNVNFTLRPSERLALVGENGEGKTTIVKLLTRLYDPTAGQILLDGVDLREYDVEDLRRVIGVIFQDFVKYEMTASDNIAVGRLDAREETGQIENAAAQSRAKEVIERLPRRYQQLLGSRFDDAVDLSGGEWQRIALARAYFRDAQLLVLDEPTAALDARSEDEVFQQFAELTEGKMSLLISHRFSTVRMANRILVISNGAIEEQGAHEELMKEGGHYAEMFGLQAAHYR
jgi:ATP-binding cassette subfamily B protein